MGRRRHKPLILEDIEIMKVADRGKGIGYAEDGRVVFVELASPGDVVDVFVQKKRKDYLSGKINALKRPSADRVEPFCAHYDSCGGCKWQHVDYAAQAQYKQTVVEDNLRRIGKVEADEWLPILPAPATQYYRNKMDFAFSTRRWLTAKELKNQDISVDKNVVGLHPPGAFDKVVDTEHCHLQGGISNDLRNFARDLGNEMNLPFYNTSAHEGYLRNIVIRQTSLEETMVILAVKTDEPERLYPYLDALLAKFPEITSLYYVINPKVNDFLLDLDMQLYHGSAYITEQLGDVKFNIGPKSFFQTNSQQAKHLYDVVVDFAGLSGTENVYDLYTGVGSIALYLAQHAKQVVGIEEIPAAIEDAKANAALNKIENCVFYAGDVKDVLSPEFAAQHGKADVVITDPPRAGMHPKAVQLLIDLGAPRIVYVSCNSATQARDLALMQDHYRVLKSRPVDMFPHTYHVENVVVLERK